MTVIWAITSKYSCQNNDTFYRNIVYVYYNEGDSYMSYNQQVLMSKQWYVLYEYCVCVL